MPFVSAGSYTCISLLFSRYYFLRFTNTISAVLKYNLFKKSPPRPSLSSRTSCYGFTQINTAPWQSSLGCQVLPFSPFFHKGSSAGAWTRSTSLRAGSSAVPPESQGWRWLSKAARTGWLPTQRLSPACSLRWRAAPAPARQGRQCLDFVIHTLLAIEGISQSKEARIFPASVWGKHVLRVWSQGGVQGAGDRQRGRVGLDTSPGY